MVWRLINFAFAVLRLLMFKVCRIIDISKTEFFSFSGTNDNNNKNNYYHHDHDDCLNSNQNPS